MKLKFLYALDKVLGKLGLLILSMLPKKTRKVSQTFSNLLVIKFLGNGSLILAAPSLYAIKQKYPNIKLILYTTKSLQQQVDVLNIFDEIILLEPLKIIQSIFQIIQLKKRFTLERTFIVNLEAFSYISNFIAAFIRGIYVISLCQFEYKRVFDKSIVINSLTNISMAEQYDKIAEVLDCYVDNSTYLNFLSKKKITQKKQFVIAPFCSNLSLLRMWELDNWSILVSELQKLYPNYFIYIIGAPSDQEQAQQIINALEHKNNVKNCCGKLSFRESSLLIQQSCCFVGIDSAPLHMARLLSVPSVSLWGATDPFVLLRDFVDYPEVVIYTKKECSPCVHTDKVCKLPKGCLNTISVSTVLYSIHNIVEGLVKSRKIL